VGGRVVKGASRDVDHVSLLYALDSSYAYSINTLSHLCHVECNVTYPMSQSTLCQLCATRNVTRRIQCHNQHKACLHLYSGSTQVHNVPVLYCPSQMAVCFSNISLNVYNLLYIIYSLLCNLVLTAQYSSSQPLHSTISHLSFKLPKSQNYLSIFPFLSPRNVHRRILKRLGKANPKCCASKSDALSQKLEQTEQKRPLNNDGP
jgi:hypothetical protein